MARSLPFVTLDVFSSKRFRGNPLGVVFLPETGTLSQEQKQLIAREFNYSETIFVHPQNAQQPNDRKIDIFTVSQELPFAGHPTIGATHWFLVQSADAQKAKLSTVSTKAGNISVSSSSQDPDIVSALIPHNVRIHSARIPLLEVARLHPTLQPYLDSSTFGDGFPVVSVVKGMTAVHVRLPSLEALNAVTTSTGGYEIPPVAATAGGYLDPGWDSDGHISLYFYVPDVWDDELQAYVIRSRMIAGNLEDPATGSAASGLAAFLTLSDDKLQGNRGGSYRVVQGVEMGRRSDIGVRVIPREGSDEIKDIELQGSAKKVCEGSLLIED